MQSNKLKLLGIGSVLFLFLVLVLGGQIFESVDADQIMVVQSPSGDLTWHVAPGIKWQGFGKVTKYQKMSDTEFKSKLMFNDNGTGYLMGKFQLELPLDAERLTALHTKYGSQEAIERSLVAPTIDKVIYMTGPLMSSKESSAERKTDLIRYIIDQVEHGVYRTRQKETLVDDVLKAGDKKKAIVADLSIKDGQVERQEESALTEFGIKIVNFAPSDLVYDDQVMTQIKKQQEITMQVQTAMAVATEAAQRKITVEADGQAEVMRAKYVKEIEKVQAVTAAQKEREVGTLQAQKDLEVSTLAAKSAEQYKRQQILIGEGDAERKKLVMAADGALEQKLAAYREVNSRYADAIARHQGAWVPSVVMGSGDSGKQGASSLIDLFTAKTAKDLALDLSVGMKR